eukprot:TRINITY_DN5963_c0_g1_i1.p1 TRINITY_DN5963_c0_g1~~TRINITY_DN5963_c0_g1_i1.p1  ORF type:complete len:299 (+),score=34.02 TRINITY_DN5963_c0_g1_i1:12-908(+)
MVYFPVGPLSSICCALYLSGVFVGSLYLWDFLDDHRQAPPPPPPPSKFALHRDHPTVIKRRFMSVTVSCIVAITLLWLLSSNDDVKYANYPFWQWLGVHTQHQFLALSLPLLLTMVLFLGPLVMWAIDIMEEGLDFIPSRDMDLVFVRNIIVGPITEEIVFRGCICPLLLSGGYGHSAVILCSPFFFGLAHLHHIRQHLHKSGKALRSAWLQVFFQLFYTTVFGTFSSFLFVRTGHLIAPCLAHMFCNIMGFPAFGEISSSRYKYLVAASFVIGLVSFIYLLMPATDPSMYNSMYYQI